MMYGMEESDSSIVPAKPANKAGKLAAEPVEGSDGTERNANLQSTNRTQSRSIVSQAQARIREAVTRNKTEKLTALLHHITVDSLHHAFLELKRDAAPGVDGETWEHYGEDLERNLTDLHRQVQAGTYRAQPSRRKYIPKADGSNGRSALPLLRTSLSKEQWWPFSRPFMRRNFWASAMDSDPDAASTKHWMRSMSD